MSNKYIEKPHLDGSSFYYPGNNTGFLLLHGFTATTAEVRPMAERLKEQGFTISAPLLPGHDTHPDGLNKVHWQDWVQTVRQAYLELRKSCDQIWLGGESMGALLCLLTAVEFPEVAGLLLFAPALELKIKGSKAAYFLQYFKKYFDKGSSKDNLEWKGYNVFPLKGFVQLMKLQKQVRKQLDKVTQPTLVFISKADKRVSVKTGETIINSISSNKKQLIVLEDSPHTMLLGHNKEQIIDKAIEFVQNASE
jgi:carboxylesterase